MDQEGTSRYAPVWFAAVCCAVLTYAAIQHPAYPVYTYYNVEVQRQVAPNKWWMKKDDGIFLYEGCPDFPNERVIWAGYIARVAKWEEQGNCKSILRPDAGFWWQRDKDGNNITIKESAYARTTR